jgi:hypothetical protein
MVASNHILGGLLDYYCEDDPAFGETCIYWTGANKWDRVSFRFSRMKDLSLLKLAGFVLEFWVRSNQSDANFEIRLQDTKTNASSARPRQVYYKIDKDTAVWDGHWHQLRIPLHAFAEHGSSDSGTWFEPVGAFDWRATKQFNITAESKDLRGVHLYFDNIRIVDPTESDSVTEWQYTDNEQGRQPASLQPDISRGLYIGQHSQMDTTREDAKVKAYLQRKIDLLTQKNASLPDGANTYLMLAKLYYGMHQKEEVSACMTKYRASLNPPKGARRYDAWLKALVDQETPIGIRFGVPMNLGPLVNAADWDYSPCISPDGLTLYFIHGNYRDGSGGKDLWMTRRARREHHWGEPVNLGPTVNSSHEEEGPFVSANGLSLYFASERPGGEGKMDIWMVTRTSTESSWSEPVNLGPTFNSPQEDAEPCLSVDGLKLYFHSMRPGGYGNQDLWIATRQTRDDPWQAPVNLGPSVNTPYHDGRPGLSPDGLTLLFNSNRPGGLGRYELWMTTRQSRSDHWEEPVWLGPVVNRPDGHGASSCFSGDGRSLFFASIRDCGFGSCDIWEVPIVSIEGSSDATRDTSVTE